jgi:hypothetical protein
VFKQRLIDNFKQDWHARLSESPKARFYNLFANFGFQKYLEVIDIKRIRINFSRFRLSSHILEIERGRYKKPVAVPINERKCKICNKLEDEFHFLFECSLYKDIRSPYIKRFYYNMPSIPKTISLLQTEKINDIRK